MADAQVVVFCMFFMAGGSVFAAHNLEKRVENLEGQLMEQLSELQNHMDSQTKAIMTALQDLGKRVEALESGRNLNHQAANQIVAFSAYNSSTRSSPEFIELGQRYRFPYILTSEGPGYDPETSVFTCPVNGIYMFSVMIPKGEESGVTMLFRLHLTKNGEKQMELYTNADDYYALALIVSGTVIISCEAGSVVEVTSQWDPFTIYWCSDGSCIFSGVLIQQLP